MWMPWEEHAALHRKAPGWNRTNNLLAVTWRSWPHGFLFQTYMSKIFPPSKDFFLLVKLPSTWGQFMVNHYHTACVHPRWVEGMSYPPDNGLQPGLHALVDYSHWNRSGLRTHWEQQKSQHCCIFCTHRLEQLSAVWFLDFMPLTCNNFFLYYSLTIVVTVLFRMMLLFI